MLVMWGVVILALVVAGALLFWNYSRKESQKKDEGESNPVRTTNSENTEQSQLGNEWKMFTICRVEKISHNVKRFRFELPVDSTLGLRCGDHCRLRYINKEGKEVSRTYTPCSPAEARGYFEIVMKIYPTGGLSDHMNTLVVGDSVEMRRRPGTLKYKPNESKKVALICGGTGITPMLQFISHVLSDKVDKTILILLFANSTDEDVLLEDELRELSEANPGRLSLYFTVSKPGASWTGLTGRIDERMMVRIGISVGNEVSRVLLCGPEGFLASAKESLAAINFASHQISVF